jgi:hypothetical protein
VSHAVRTRNYSSSTMFLNASFHITDSHQKAVVSRRHWGKRAEGGGRIWASTRGLTHLQLVRVHCSVTLHIAST